MFMLMVISSCSNNKVTQRIMGAGDCMSCSGWSWSNGVATTTAGTYWDEDYSVFAFTTTISGDLSFSYKKEHHYTNELLVAIGEKMYFQESSDGPNIYKRVSIGYVKAGEIVTFAGYGYSVRNIVIVGTSEL